MTFLMVHWAIEARLLQVARVDTGMNAGQERSLLWWTLEPLRGYARFSGRARRKEYWCFALASSATSVVLGVLDAAIGTYRYEWGIGLISGLFAVAVLVPAWAVEVRRLHDIGVSGWWLLVLAIPVVGFIGLTVAACLDSDMGSNSYGADPKAAERAGRIVKHTKVRGVAVAVLSLGLSIPACWILAVVLSILYPPPLGHYSPLTGQAGPYIFVLMLMSLALIPVTLVVGAVALLKGGWLDPSGRPGGGFGMVLTGTVLAAFVTFLGLLSWWLHPTASQLFH